MGKQRTVFLACALLSLATTGCLTIEPWQKPIETLIERLRDRDQVVRAEAASNLGDHAVGLDDDEEAHAAVTALRLALRDPFDEVRLCAAGGLEGLGPRAAPAVADLVAAATGDPDRRVRFLAWRALAGIGPPALPALQGAAAAPREQTRLAALGALERSLDPDSGGPLRQHVDAFPNPKHTRVVIEALARALQDRSGRVRRLAVQVLGRRFSPWPEAIGAALTLALDDVDDRVAASAARALASLDRIPPHAPRALHRLLAPPRELGRGLHDLFSLEQPATVAASIALIQHGYTPERALAPLLAAAADPGAADRVGAIRALRAFNGRAVAITPDLIPLLDDGAIDPALRSAAVRTLASIGPAARKAEPALRRILYGDVDQRLREAARRALALVAPR